MDGEKAGGSMFMCRLCNLFSPSRGQLLLHCSQKHPLQPPPEELIIAMQPLSPGSAEATPAFAKRKRGRPKGSTKKKRPDWSEVKAGSAHSSKDKDEGEEEERGRGEEKNKAECQERQEAEATEGEQLECRRCHRCFRTRRQILKHICLKVEEEEEEEETNGPESSPGVRGPLVSGSLEPVCGADPVNQSQTRTILMKTKDVDRPKTPRTNKKSRTPCTDRRPNRKEAGPAAGNRKSIISVVLTEHETLADATKMVPVEASPAEMDSAGVQAQPQDSAASQSVSGTGDCPSKPSSDPEPSQLNGESPPKQVTPAANRGFQEYAIKQVANSLQSQLKIFTCEFCNKIFKFRHSLTAHLRTHTQEKPFHCPHCDYASAIKANLNVHLRKHTGEKFSCPHCAFTCLSPGHLKVHIERVHLKVKQHCEFCQKKYSDVKTLLKHMEKRHNLKDPDIQHSYQQLRLKTRQGQRQLLYHCSTCGRRFKNHLERQRHLLVHGPLRPYACLLCDHATTGTAALVAHVRKHLFLYVCSLCGGAFVSSPRLKAHLAEAHPELSDAERAFADCIERSYCLGPPGGDMERPGEVEEEGVEEVEEGKRREGEQPEAGESEEGRVEERGEEEEEGRPEDLSGEKRRRGGDGGEGEGEGGDAAAVEERGGEGEGEGGDAAALEKRGGGDGGEGEGEGGDAAAVEERGGEGEGEGGDAAAVEERGGGEREEEERPAATAQEERREGEKEEEEKEVENRRSSEPEEGGPKTASPPSDAREEERTETQDGPEGMAGDRPQDGKTCTPGDESAPLAPPAEHAHVQTEESAHAPDADSAQVSVEAPDQVSVEAPDQTAFQQVLSSLQKTQLNMETFQRLRRLYGDLECQFCGKLFWYQAHYNLHVRTHTKEHMHYCSKCSYSSITKSCLKRHLVQKHSGVLLPCSEAGCTYATPDKYKLQAHEKTHQQQGTEACPVCQQKYPENRLKHHIRTAHPDTDSVHNKSVMVKRGEKCPYCDSYFLKNSSDLQQHIWAHQGVKPYRCEVCDYAGRSKSNLRAHMNTHCSERTHLCDLCGKKFKSKVTLRTHRLTHSEEGRKFHCSECEYTTVSKPTLLRHMEQHADFKPYRCAHCHYSCNIAGPLKRHYSQKHPEQEYQNAGPGLSDTDAVEPPGALKCPVCKFVYGTKWELNRHLKNRHNLKLVEGHSAWEVLETVEGQYVSVEDEDQQTEAAVAALQDNAGAVNILQQIIELSSENPDAVASVVTMAPGTVTVVEQVSQQEQESGNHGDQVMVVEGEEGRHGDQLMVVEETEGLETLTVLTQGESAHHYIVYVEEQTVEIN